MAKAGRHMPQGRGWKLTKNGKPFHATLIKWVRMSDKAAIVIFKVRAPKGRQGRR
jgi:hypothetical protein